MVHDDEEFRPGLLDLLDQQVHGIYVRMRTPTVLDAVGGLDSGWRVIGYWRHGAPSLALDLSP